MEITETIFSGTVGAETIIIPMADVQHIEIETWGNDVVRKTYTIITKKTVRKNGIYQNPIKLKHYMGEKFMVAWMNYRNELDQMLPPYRNIEPLGSGYEMAKKEMEEI